MWTPGRGGKSAGRGRTDYFHGRQRAGVRDAMTNLPAAPTRRPRNTGFAGTRRGGSGTGFCEIQRRRGGGVTWIRHSVSWAGAVAGIWQPFTATKTGDATYKPTTAKRVQMTVTTTLPPGKRLTVNKPLTAV